MPMYSPFKNSGLFSPMRGMVEYSIEPTKIEGRDLASQFAGQEMSSTPASYKNRPITDSLRDTPSYNNSPPSQSKREGGQMTSKRSPNDGVAIHMKNG
jgi:hypothetical protein